jgi:uncharacterized protein
MGGSLPDYIEPFRCAEARARYAGEIALGGMTEMAICPPDEGEKAFFDLQFGVDDEGTRFVSTRVTAVVKVICQRCLQVMRLELEGASRLGIVASEEAANRLPGGYEPLVVPDGTLRLRRLIEDELILNMPIAPKHRGGGCGSGIPDTAATATNRPLADLGRLIAATRADPNRPNQG